ncbi:MAG: hypothetical protein QOJ39_1106 [Candidatus Eremiobacteraeota bacterium]|jgi:hypothetical protein|nr:hypothetical protein [Candidatus Eremiobacteraeota bacterium]MEA2719242.1 hypothetical protein [Candidatus Eremiobacteraeota bacterium]
MTLIDQLFRRSETLWFDSASEGREGTFDAVAMSGGKRIPVVGTRIARDGIAFLSQVEMRGTEVPLTFTIRRRIIPSRVRIVKEQPVQAAERIVHRYFCSFTVIADADRDAVARYVANLPEPAVLAEPVADDSGSLTARVRAQIADHLVRLKRLASPAPGMAPLIRLDAAAPRELEDGRTARDVVVHSRLRTSDGVRSFQTKFRVYTDDRIDVLT